MNGMTLRRLGLADQHDSRQGNGSVMMKLYIMTVISIVPNKMTKKKPPMNHHSYLQGILLSAFI